MIEIKRKKIEVLIGKLIKDSKEVLFKIGNVSIEFKEKKELMNDRKKMEFIGSEKRKKLIKVEKNMIEEERECES